jgi:hypothetical protein
MWCYAVMSIGLYASRSLGARDGLSSWYDSLPSPRTSQIAMTSLWVNVFRVYVNVYVASGDSRCPSHRPIQDIIFTSTLSRLRLWNKIHFPVVMEFVVDSSQSADMCEKHVSSDSTEQYNGNISKISRLTQGDKHPSDSLNSLFSTILTFVEQKRSTIRGRVLRSRCRILLGYWLSKPV